MALGSMRKKLRAFFLRSSARENGTDCQLARLSPNALICSSGQRDRTSGTSVLTPVASGELSSKPVPHDASEVGVNPLSPNSLSHANEKHTKAPWFQDSHHFVLEHCNIVDTVNRTTTVNIQGSSIRTKAMKLLLKHAIPGSAYDSAARDPPPRCHLGTRTNIKERLLAWFYDKEKRELVFWLYGPAGVGKLAIVQTFAETLAESKCLGASVFISRPHKRNDSQRIFITIAYQLAVRIEDYSIFIAEKLALDPQLVNKGLKEQFRIFIVEPFVEKKIGAGEEPWGILLDGLDELDEQHWQREIISLIATFATNHPKVPLTWIIASRPEPHISVEFKRQLGYLKECIPIDSPEACQDVQCYLNASFDKIRNEFPFTVPDCWPGEMALRKLASAASGLFVFASVAISFIGDSKCADPVTRLDLILSVVNGSTIAPFEDQPFAHLDALYTGILALIPSKMWLTTKRVLSVGLNIKRSNLKTYWEHQCLNTLKGISAFSGVESRMIYVSLNDCYFVLRIPLPENAYSEPVTFYHTSFSDFLMDPTRSNEYHISIENAEDNILQSLLIIWRDFRRNYPPSPDSEYFARWKEHCLKYHQQEISSKKLDLVIDDFDHRLFHYTHRALFDLLIKKSDFALQQTREQCFDLLTLLDSTTACQGFHDCRPQLVLSLFDIWEKFRKPLIERGLVREVRFSELKFNQLYWPEMYPTHTLCDKAQVFHESRTYLTVEPKSVEGCREYLSVLQDFQRRCGQLRVLVCGSNPGKRFALLAYEYTEDELKIQSHCPFPRNPYISGCCGYYTIPYPNET